MKVKFKYLLFAITIDAIIFLSLLSYTLLPLLKEFDGYCGISLLGQGHIPCSFTEYFFDALSFSIFLGLPLYLITFLLIILIPVLVLCIGQKKMDKNFGLTRVL